MIGVARATLPRSARRRLAPPATGLPLGAYRGNGATTAFDAYGAWLGRPLAIRVDVIRHEVGLDAIALRTSWDRTVWGRVATWLAADARRVASCQYRPVPNGGTAEDAAAGAYDAAWTEGLTWLAQNGVDRLLVNPFHEYNGGWYPWGVGFDETRMANAIAPAFRRFVDIARPIAAAAGCSWAYVWNPNHDGLQMPSHIAAGYPGDGYVDYCGIDIYDDVWGRAPDDPTRWPTLKARWDGLVAFAADHGKPVCVPEWGIWHDPNRNGQGGDNPTFIENMWGEIHDPANNVAWHCYYAEPAAHHDLMLVADGGTGISPNSTAKYFELLPRNPPAADASGLVAVRRPVVLGYYPGWEQGTMPPAEIDMTALTHVNHFSAKPNADGTLDTATHVLTTENSTAIIAHAHAQGAKVLLTIGGGGTGDRFRAATADAPTRAALVGNIVSLAVDRGYDGVDVDWEAVTDPDHAVFQSFIAELRAALPAGRLLTAAVQMDGPGFNPSAAYAAVIDRFDFISLMAYDLAGPWEGWMTWPGSALVNGGLTFPGGNTSEMPCADLMVRQYLAAGIPRGKIVLGVPFHGTIWQGGSGTATGGVTAPQQTWDALAASPSYSLDLHYRHIVARADYAGNVYWDDTTKTPYLGVDAAADADDVYLPHEDERSIREKVGFVSGQNLAGLMIWQLASGYFPANPQAQRHPLLAALKAEYQARFGVPPNTAATPLSTSSYADANYVLEGYVL